jgi:hypothetical protein
MSARTIFLSKLLGLYCILGGFAMLVHTHTTVPLVEALVNDAPLMFFAGVFTLIGGLAMVLAHNYWSGGALPVVVTIIGWLTAIKGALILFMSPTQAPGFFLGAFSYEQHYYGFSVFSILVGVYLTYAGFTAKAA